MDFEQARTFLAVVAHGSFIEAAQKLHVTQSTVSARIQRLEQDFDTLLFTRNRAGASLTPAGRRFMPHAKALLRTLEQARHDLGLSERYRGSLRVGARIALWEEFLPTWSGAIRTIAPDIALRSEIGFEEDLMRRLTEGSLDIGLMYTPTHVPDLVVEQLFDETLILVSTRANASWNDDDYIYVDWGPGFYTKHQEAFPNPMPIGQTVNIGWLGIQLILRNGGSCFLPSRIARPLIQAKRVHEISHAPTFHQPAYMVFPKHPENQTLQTAVTLLRDLAKREHNNPASTSSGVGSSGLLSGLLHGN